MSTNIVPITLREAPWQNLANEIVIGKDILELLSSSMYVDPMTIENAGAILGRTTPLSRRGVA
jgi:hypothetical protein